jgi:IS1 family transposase
MQGNPHVDLISTSHVEKQNHTLRMHCRRLTRLTNAFSKKLENFKAAVALHYAYYNFVKSNIAIRCTPAMAAGVTNTFWRVRDLVTMIEA